MFTSSIQFLSHSISRYSAIGLPLRFFGSLAATSDSAQSTQKTPGKRGGQNLTHRDIHLSNLIRLELRRARVAETNESVSAIDEDTAPDNQGATSVESATPPKRSGKVFRGINLPQKPRPPEPEECCMSGCAICVYDLYLGSLETYREALSAVRTRLRSQDIPCQDWPDEIQEMGDKETWKASDLDVNMSAFAALEKSLREASREKSLSK